MSEMKSATDAEAKNTGSETGLVRLRREAEVPRPRLERMLVAWALANVFLVVTMCGGLVAIRAAAPTTASDAGTQQAQVQHRGTEVISVRVYETPPTQAVKKRSWRCGTR